MKKCDFKKLAIMGLASGAILATQAADAAQEIHTQNQGVYLAGNHCGAGSCGNSTPPNPNGGTPPRVTPAHGNQTSAKPVQSNGSCATKASCAGKSQPTQPTGSCHGKSSCSGKTQPAQLSNNCHGPSSCSGKTGTPQKPNQMNSSAQKGNIGLNEPRGQSYQYTPQNGRITTAYNGADNSPSTPVDTKGGNKPTSSTGSSKKEGDVGYNVAKQHHHQKYTSNNSNRSKLLQDDNKGDPTDGDDESDNTKKDIKGIPSTGASKNIPKSVK